MRPTVTARVIAFGCLLGSGVTTLTARTAEADAITDQTLGQMVDLNKKALAAYTGGDGEMAKRLLEQALGLGQQSGLAQHEMMARTYLHLGAVQIVLLHDRVRGMRAFSDALAIRRDIKLTPSIATPALRRDLVAARAFKPTEPPSLDPSKPVPAASPALAVSPGKDKEPAPTSKTSPPVADKKNDEPVAKAPGPVNQTANQTGKQASNQAANQIGNQEEPDLPVHVPQPLYCPTPVEGPPGEDVRLNCLTQSEVKARRLVVYYRPAAGWDYTKITMGHTKKGWYRAIIPGKAVTGHSLQYYVEARGPGNRLAAGDGKEELPNVIMLKEGTPQIGVGAIAAAHFVTKQVSDPHEASPLEVREQQREQKAERAEQDASRPRRPPHSLWLGLGLGSGYGWHLRLPLERHTNRDVAAGVSPAGLGHVIPEIGFQITRGFALSIQSRHEYIPTTGSGDPEVVGSPPQTASAIMLRGHFLVGDAGNFQLVATGSAGYGSALRMKVPPAPDSGLVASDTVVSGPAIFGPGLSLAYNFTTKLIAGIEARALAGVPNLAVVGELNLGVQYAF